MASVWVQNEMHSVVLVCYSRRNKEEKMESITAIELVPIQKVVERRATIEPT